MTTRRFSTSFIALLAALVATAGLAVALALPAQAHSELISSSPADGDKLYEYPETITLEFNEDIQAIGNEIVVVGPDGSDVTDGDPQVDGPIVTIDVASAPDDPAAGIGSWTVTWRVVSADGHPISGEFTFDTVQTTISDEVVDESTSAEETTSPETTEAADTEATATSSDADDEDGGSDAAVPIAIGVLVLAIAGVVVLAIRRKRAR